MGSYRTRGSHATSGGKARQAAQPSALDAALAQHAVDPMDEVASVPSDVSSDLFSLASSTRGSADEASEVSEDSASFSARLRDGGASDSGRSSISSPRAGDSSSPRGTFGHRRHHRVGSHGSMPSIQKRHSYRTLDTVDSGTSGGSFDSSHDGALEVNTQRHGRGRRGQPRGSGGGGGSGAGGGGTDSFLSDDDTADESDSSPAWHRRRQQRGSLKITSAVQFPHGVLPAGGRRKPTGLHHGVRSVRFMDGDAEGEGVYHQRGGDETGDDEVEEEEEEEGDTDIEDASVRVAGRPLSNFKTSATLAAKFVTALGGSARRGSHSFSGSPRVTVVRRPMNRLGAKARAVAGFSSAPNVRTARLRATKNRSTTSHGASVSTTAVPARQAPPIRTVGLGRHKQLVAKSLSAWQQSITGLPPGIDDGAASVSTAGQSTALSVSTAATAQQRPRGAGLLALITDKRKRSAMVSVAAMIERLKRYIVPPTVDGEQVGARRGSTSSTHAGTTPAPNPNEIALMLPASDVDLSQRKLFAAAMRMWARASDVVELHVVGASIQRLGRGIGYLSNLRVLRIVVPTHQQTAALHDDIRKAQAPQRVVQHSASFKGYSYEARK